MKLNLALLAAAATGVQVGAAIVASRFVVAEVPPLTLALLRYAIGFACLPPFFLKHFMAPALDGQARAAIKNIAISDWLVMAALGTGQFAVLIALLNYGLQHIEAAQAALIFSLFPLLTLLLSSALGRERISAALLAGVLFSITGVALSLWPKLQVPHPGHWWGEAAVLASAGVGALCSVLYRPYLQRYPTLAVSSFAMLVSVLFLGLLALTENWPARVMALGLQSWTVVALIGISSGIGYFWWLYALKHESPTRVTVFLALNPLTAALLGVLFLGEALSPWSAAAIFLIASGLWLATRGAAPARR
ncbi:MAG: DMT family transporter [Polaromonas sp.]|uniref:DMT family transporter n=1 Tax=Polaromonas sp. TaxID=1869339 RepID=UPI00272F8D6C|nr:DMT family transporter [Polaromonas sp.]MDP2448861.1 DMT family transporter [Polaromonas sp.]MDP3245819.1 DMT family transporter [Polaromonas sp.]MDP3755358.1 DMT family transporter [Polaromonas sp.]